MKYKMIVSDVDGTLLDPEHRLPEETRKAIELYRRRGGLFSLATGRIEKSAVRLQQELSIDLPLILYNGAKIVDLSRNRVVFEKCLTREQSLAAVKALGAAPLSAIFYSEGEGYTFSYTDNIRIHSEMEGITPLLADNADRINLSKVSKILFAGNNDENDDELFEGFLKEYRKLCRNLPFIVRSNWKYLELLPEGVNKGSALEVLAQHLGIDMNEIMCFGDNLNDLEMIQKAGLGVAMENGHELLKKEADVVAPANTESGVAHVIRKFLEENSS